MPWTATDPRWAALSPFQKAAVISMMEANSGPNQMRDAGDVIGAMVNRARMSGQDLGQHVGQSIYQPTIEPTQQARFSSIIASPNFPRLTQFAQDRWEGNAEDPVGGATHFLAPERTMETLSAREPGKYRTWRGWTGYGRESPGQYSNPDHAPVFRDSSHAFLSPEGAYSAPGSYGGSGFKKAQFDELADAFGPGTVTTPSPFAAPVSPEVPQRDEAPRASPPPQPPAPGPVALATPPADKPAQESPFTKAQPKAADNSFDQFAANAVANAQRTAQAWMQQRKPVRGLSTLNDQLFGAG